MRALIAVSVSRQWCETDFLQQMGTWSMPKGWEFRYGWLRGFTAAERHNAAANESVNYDRLLFMDTDQIYPYDYLEKMLAHDEPVVSALNVSRYYPFEFCCFRLDRVEKAGDLEWPRVEAIQPPAEPCFSCDMVGTGALMLDSSVFQKTPAPFFKDIYDSDGRRLCPDDFYFGWQLYRAGLRPLVDQSIHMEHITQIRVNRNNAHGLRTAWELARSGYGSWKDGVQA